MFPVNVKMGMAVFSFLYEVLDAYYHIDKSKAINNQAAMFPE
jgi:hypothetical protein